MEGILKIIDNILASGANIKDIEPLIRRILNIFRKKLKFNISW